MIKAITAMPEELQARFKALMVLYQSTENIDEEEEKASRDLELKYEKQYQEIYEQRAKVLKGEVELEKENIDKFDQMRTDYEDAEYEKLEVPICDVKDIQNVPKGVPGFWLRSMIANKHLKDLITEKDRPILQYL